MYKIYYVCVCVDNILTNIYPHNDLPFWSAEVDIVDNWGTNGWIWVKLTLPCVVECPLILRRVWHDSGENKDFAILVCRS